MRKYSAVLLAAAATAALATVIPPAATAEVCGNIGGPNLNVNGCLTPGEIQRGAAIIGGLALADVTDAEQQAAAGRPPCYTRAGVPYYTPGDAPCL